MTPPGFEGEAESAPSCSLAVTRPTSQGNQPALDELERRIVTTVRSTVGGDVSTVDAQLDAACQAWSNDRKPSELRTRLLDILLILDREG